MHHFDGIKCHKQQAASVDLRPATPFLATDQPSTDRSNLVLCLKDQLPQAAAPSATTMAPAAATSSKKSAKKAAKSAKKQAKQQPQPPSVGAGAVMSGTPTFFLGWTLEWAAVVLGLARGHAVLRAAVLDGWQLLRWLEVRGLLRMCQRLMGTLHSFHCIHAGHLVAATGTAAMLPSWTICRCSILLASRLKACLVLQKAEVVECHERDVTFTGPALWNKRHP
jgi:hypothetical protein